MLYIPSKKEAKSLTVSECKYYLYFMPLNYFRTPKKIRQKHKQSFIEVFEILKNRLKNG